MADAKSQAADAKVDLKKRASRECLKCGKKFRLFSSLKRHLIESTECSRNRRKQKETKGISAYQIIIPFNLLQKEDLYEE